MQPLVFEAAGGLCAWPTGAGLRDIDQCETSKPARSAGSGLRAMASISPNSRRPAAQPSNLSIVLPLRAAPEVAFQRVVDGGRGDAAVADGNGYLVQRADDVTGGVEPIDRGHLVAVHAECSILVRLRAGGLGQGRLGGAPQEHVHTVERFERSVCHFERTSLPPEPKVPPVRDDAHAQCRRPPEHRVITWLADRPDECHVRRIRTHDLRVVQSRLAGPVHGDSLVAGLIAVAHGAQPQRTHPDRRLYPVDVGEHIENAGCKEHLARGDRVSVGIDKAESIFVPGQAFNPGRARACTVARQLVPQPGQQPVSGNAAGKPGTVVALGYPVRPARTAIEHDHRAAETREVKRAGQSGRACTNDGAVVRGRRIAAIDPGLPCHWARHRSSLTLHSRSSSYCEAGYSPEGSCCGTAATTRIPKLPGLIVGRGCGSALVGAGRGPSSAADRYTRPVASSSARVRALFWVGTFAITW